jgi:ADP-ribose pyrophosphatase
MQATRILQGEVFDVDRVEWTDASGRALVRHIVRHPGAVTVVPVLDDGRLVMIRNWRVSVERWLLEFCAGKLERGEEPAAAAARELVEETGHRAAMIRPLGTYLTSPGFADERMHAFEATGLVEVPRSLQPGERIEVVLHTPDELERLIGQGAVEDGKTITAFALWKAAHR